MRGCLKTACGRVTILCTVAIILVAGAPAGAQAQADVAGLPPVDERTTSELNVSIAVFDPGVPADPRAYRRLDVFPKIREIEAFLLPFMLRDTLIATGEWGAVRIVPESDAASELLVTGEIVRSDGGALELLVRAVDAGGNEWLNGLYVSTSFSSVGPSETGSDSSAYPELFDAIAEDLRNARESRNDESLSDILEISFLRYAGQLAPDIFGDYLYHAPEGTVTIQRLPAENDPMLGRIERIRQSEYLFIDTVDEKFQDLHTEIESIYDLWLNYRYQVAQYENSEVERVQNSSSRGPRGSYEAIKSLYDNYSWARMQDQRQANRAQAFDNEVGPTVREMEARVAELEEWLDQQYLEWRTLLAELFYIETGLTE